MSAADALEKAADYIEEHGWCRNVFERNGHVCALGAIGEVAHYEDHDPAIAALGQYVGTVRSKDWRRTVWRWNDRQRYRYVVTRTMRQCAASLRAAS